MKTADDILACVEEILTDPAHWTQGSFARDHLTFRVGPRTAEATAFCLIGAVMHCDEDGYGKPQGLSSLGQACVVRLQRAIKGDVVIFNDRDGRTHDEILAVVRAARAAA